MWIRTAPRLRAYGIRGIPALLFFKGGKVADQVVGYVPQNVIEEKVQRILG